jgi:hypothetical protein
MQIKKNGNCKVIKKEFRKYGCSSFWNRFYTYPYLFFNMTLSYVHMFITDNLENGLII